jgi:hypothetical protein
MNQINFYFFSGGHSPDNHFVWRNTIGRQTKLVAV